MCEIGTIRFLGAIGDLVVGNIFGGEFEMFVYHADTGMMDLPAARPEGKLFGIFSSERRQALLLRFNGSLYTFDAAGKTIVPGFVDTHAHFEIAGG